MARYFTAKPDAPAYRAVVEYRRNGQRAAYGPYTSKGAAKAAVTRETRYLAPESFIGYVEVLEGAWEVAQ
ncbi:hypothetical protein SEA_EMOTION_62 [Arthrobacter phage Emotion]|uniref:Uncharacterized protein n=1 Tax=Arthrobacter phage Emotion TaxID=3038361 RepID=A0AA49ESB8_9CAUD|nr:hypothetical protein SEA_EMOTION_62 [Arthrobacter phage Emotion]